MKFREALLWDTNPATIDTKEHADYIIERVLDFGNDKEVKWLKYSDSPQHIKRVVERSRSLRSRTKKLWTLLLKTQ